MKSPITRFLSAAVFAALISTAIASPAEAVWTATTIVTNGQYSSLGIDSSDAIHVSYYRGYPYRDLGYATNESGVWATTTIDSVGVVGRESSLVLDSSDAVHIAYWDSTNGNLKYATNASGTWATSTIDSSGYVSAYFAMAIDPTTDVLHIAYSNAGDLNYATNASGSWVTTVVASDPSDSFHSPSIAVDSSGAAHIAYVRRPNTDEVGYATNASGTWVTTTIASVVIETPYFATAIAITPSDTIDIVYEGSVADNYPLKFVNNPSGIWETTTIDPSIGSDTQLSLALFSTDTYVAYTRGGSLHLATDETGIWQHSVIATDARNQPSIQLDSTGDVFISYTNNGSTYGDLVLVTNQ